MRNITPPPPYDAFLMKVIVSNIQLVHCSIYTKIIDEILTTASRQFHKFWGK